MNAELTQLIEKIERAIREALEWGKTGLDVFGPPPAKEELKVIQKKNAVRHSAREASRCLEKLKDLISEGSKEDVAIWALRCGVFAAQIQNTILKGNLARKPKRSELIDDYIRERRAIREFNGNLRPDEKIADDLNAKMEIDKDYRPLHSRAKEWTRQSVQKRRERAAID